ncbi:MAG: response regulator [Nitrospirota bacterium]
MNINDNIPNVLIIDDDKGMCRTLSHILGLDGYKVSTANTGSEGAARIKEGFFDIAILDIRLPDIDGVELLEAIKKTNPDLNIIMMTAYASIENAIKALNVGADAFVTKPLRIEELRAVVKKSIDKQRLANEKKRLEIELKESLEKYRELFESINDAVAVFMVPDGELSIYNTRFSGLLGYSEQELKGKKISDLIHPEDIPAAQERFEKRISGEAGEDIYELRALNKNGEVIFLEIGDCSYYQKGAAVGVEFIMRDISERKKIEEQLIQSEKLRVIGQLASGVAHDFNNALAIILGNIELLVRQVDTVSLEQIKRQLRVIETAAIDAAETVRRIQEFTRTRADKEFSRVDINEIIEEVKEMSKPRWKDYAHEKGVDIELTTLLDQGLPYIMGSPSELREVLTNIIFNSIDAMPKGGKIVIETRALDKEVQVVVADTGVGIPREVRRRIFDPFFTTKGVVSDGLGLSIAYSIISRHGGRIDVESEEGKGTTVTINLPIPLELKEVAGKCIPTKEVKRTNILVIEDEEMVRVLLEQLLTQSGHNVFKASSGDEGLKIFYKGGIDLVFTDLGMPGMSGWEVARSIKVKDPDTPVVLITGWGVQIDDEKIKESGVDLVISKPFKLDQVLNTVAEALDIKRKLSPIP